MDQDLCACLALRPPLYCCTAAADSEHLGSLSESGLSDALINPFAPPGGAAAGSYDSPYTAQLQAAAAAGVGVGGIGAAAGDINPRQGLDAGLLDSLFERPSAELVRRSGEGDLTLLFDFSCS
jgi:hypothetical protein